MIEAPDLLAVDGPEGHHFAPDAKIGAGLADEDHVFPDQGGRGGVFPLGRVHDPPVPQQGAGFRVEGDQMAVGRAADDAAAAIAAPLLFAARGWSGL